MNKIKVGDRVTIKSWDEMVVEFGVDDGGDIMCKFSFIKSMKHLCNESGSVIGIDEEDVIKIRG